MNKLYYDLHIHSCLSPCADNECTPNNIIGMGVLAGLNIMALTDHNTCKNCPAFFKAAGKMNIIPIAGMELTTAEDIHVIFLFSELKCAMDFDEYVNSRRILIENRTDIFGDQLILDGDDNIIGQEKYLLSNATGIMLSECPEVAEKFGGVCYPAHIDREANGVIAALGTFPSDTYFKCAEFHDKQNIEEYCKKYSVSDKLPVISSDAHYLWDIKDKENYFEFRDGLTYDEIPAELLRKLR